MSLVLAQHADVVFTRLSESEAVLLHLGTQRYYTLNGSAIAIWEAFETPATLEAAARRLTERFEIDEAEAAQSVLAFTIELRSDGLLRLA